MPVGSTPDGSFHLRVVIEPPGFEAPEYVVVLSTESRREGASGILVLLTGNGNGLEHEVPGYEAVLNAMWTHDHSSNPAWLPCFLRSLLATLGYNGVKQKIDLCGVSRGAQALLSLF